jgi:hypothetical protein
MNKPMPKCDLSKCLPCNIKFLEAVNATLDGHGERTKWQRAGLDLVVANLRSMVDAEAERVCELVNQQIEVVQ